MKARLNRIVAIVLAIAGVLVAMSAAEMNHLQLPVTQFHQEKTV